MAMALAAPMVSACCQGLCSSKGATPEAGNIGSRLGGSLWGQKLKTGNQKLTSIAKVAKLSSNVAVRAMIEENRTEVPSAGLASMGTNEQLAQHILSGRFSADDCRGQQGDSTLMSQKEFTSRTGRRGFSRSCLITLAVYPIMGKSGDAISVEAPLKSEKKKGRAPSSPFDEDRLLEQNRRMQRLNNAPTEFPGFVREGFQVKVITSEKYVTSRSGLIYYDMVVGQGDLPQDGQQVIFHYTGYNESGRRVDSSYQQGRPARTRLGIQGMIPGFEEGIKTMRAGGRRIIIVPPELGPPVGPSTFFSAKQFEVFDVELLEAKDCSRRTLLFYSDVVCD